MKTPDPKVYKGDPDDLNRFLLQVENKFVMEPNRFDTDLIKIRYTGQLLDGKAYKWYQSYHLQISPKDAYRVRGLRTLDPKFASWDRFEASLRSSFGERVTRDQAVREWHKLRYTDSVDDFVDEIIRLIWLTDYEGAVVEDKVKHGLSGELRREWAKLAQKPQEIGEQLAILRDMGHVLEDCDRREAKPPGTNSGRKGGQKDAGAGKTGGNSKGAPGKPNAQQKPKQSQKGSEGQKSRDEALKGISEEVLEERRKAKTCLKCGKGTHKWVDCWTKAPVTARVASSAKRSRKGSKGVNPDAETASAKEAEKASAASGRLIEIPEDAPDDLDLWSV